MNRIYIGSLGEHAGKEVLIKGWVDVRRDQGKMIFMDFRDMSGKIQGVILPGSPAMEVGQIVRPEWVVAVTGKINKRPERNVQKDKVNGDIEIEILGIEVLNQAETLPFDIQGDTSDLDESLRLKYRYLDIRSERMQRNLRLRNEFTQKIRSYLLNEKFTEIETPLLTQTTPEGSRDFVVPSRIHPGKFYALPQSPQQYKQLLMVGGMEKYFQFPRALRDEDLRADRGFEHTQADIEMSFVERDDVMNLVEKMMIETVESMGYTIREKPFPRISYKDAIATYGADKFDMRTEEEKTKGILAYAWVIDFPMFEAVEDDGITGGGKGKWTFSHNPFSAPMPESAEDHAKGINIENIVSAQYDLVCNGFEAGGGSIRAHTPEMLRATYQIMGYSEQEIQDSVGHILEAFKYGTPPHGGIALGVERNVMNLTGEAYLREVQAFPQTRRGQTSVMNAPSDLSPKQLAELGLEIKIKPKK